jgi:WhiB family transcriptional regulator, redox-sensing transcriptional regulator
MFSPAHGFSMSSARSAVAHEDRAVALELLMLINNASAAGGWMSRGACRHEDPELFFPISEGAAHLAAAAKAVCQACSVRASCLAFAVETRQHGIWGATTSDERRAMCRKAPRHGMAGPGPAVSIGQDCR